MKPAATAAPAEETVRFLTPPELAAWAAQPGVTVHRYHLYWQSLAPFLFAATLLLFAAIWWPMNHGLAGPFNVGFVALLVAFCGWALWVSIYWATFPNKVFVARTATDLVLVDGARAWRIPLAMLRSEHINRKQLGQSDRKATLPLHIGGHRFSILLLGHFVKLDNHLSLVAALLEVIMLRKQNDG